MRESNLLGKQNFPQLRMKQKLIVFYSSKEDKDVLIELRNKFNTCTCKYTITLIHIRQVESIINEVTIKKYMKACVSGYKSELDRICIIDSSVGEFDHCNVFHSVDKFKLWLQKIIDRENEDKLILITDER